MVCFMVYFVFKVLTVQIREDMVLDDTVMANTDRSPRPLVPQAATPLIAVSTPGRNTQDHLKVMRQEITFPTNVIGTTTSKLLAFKEFFEIANSIICVRN